MTRGIRDCQVEMRTEDFLMARNNGLLLLMALLIRECLLKDPLLKATLLKATFPRDPLVEIPCRCVYVNVCGIMADLCMQALIRISFTFGSPTINHVSL